MVRTVRRRAVIWSGLVGLLVVMGGCGGENAASSDVQTQPEATGVVEHPAVGEPTQQAEVQVPSETQAQQGEAVALALHFAPGQAATYRLVSEDEKSVRWEGARGTQPTGFNGGRTGNQIEMTFEQQVQSVDASGSAVLRITIQALKYLGRVREKVVLDYDSSRAAQQDSALAVLIGQSYLIQMSPKGAVMKVVDAGAVRAAVPEQAPSARTAQRLLSDDEITQRHTISALAALADGRVRLGQQWSDVKPFAFGMMGARSYERLYTLREVVGTDAEQVAVVEMKGIPSGAMAQEMHRQRSGSTLSRMFDNTESYKGRLELELGAGQVRVDAEQLQIEWVAVDPAAAEGEAEPSVLRMATRQLRRLERLE